MDVEIQSKEITLDKAIEAHIQRKIKLGLSKLESNISSISICLSDVISKPITSPSIDIPTIRCSLKIMMNNLKSIEVEDTQNDLYCAIDRVIQKASRSITRLLSSPGANIEK